MGQGPVWGGGAAGAGSRGRPGKPPRCPPHLVHEHVFAAVLRHDEPKALAVVEPLHRAHGLDQSEVDPAVGVRCQMTDQFAVHEVFAAVDDGGAGDQLRCRYGDVGVVAPLGWWVESPLEQSVVIQQAAHAKASTVPQKGFDGSTPRY